MTSTCSGFRIPVARSGRSDRSLRSERSGRSRRCGGSDFDDADRAGAAEGFSGLKNPRILAIRDFLDFFGGSRRTLSLVSRLGRRPPRREERREPLGEYSVGISFLFVAGHGRILWHRGAWHVHPRTPGSRPFIPRRCDPLRWLFEKKILCREEHGMRSWTQFGRRDIPSQPNRMAFGKRLRFQGLFHNHRSDSSSKNFERKILRV